MVISEQWMWKDLEDSGRGLNSVLFRDLPLGIKEFKGKPHPG